MSSVVSPYSLCSENINKQQMRDMSSKIYVLLMSHGKGRFQLTCANANRGDVLPAGSSKQVPHPLHFGKQFRIFSTTAHEE